MADNEDKKQQENEQQQLPVVMAVVAEPVPQVIAVTVPPGAFPGQHMQVQTGNGIVTIQVPAGVRAGQQIQFTIPSSVMSSTTMTSPPIIGGGGIGGTIVPPLNSQPPTGCIPYFNPFLCTIFWLVVNFGVVFWSVSWWGYIPGGFCFFLNLEAYQTVSRFYKSGFVMMYSGSRTRLSNLIPAMWVVTIVFMIYIIVNLVLIITVFIFLIVLEPAVLILGCLGVILVSFLVCANINATVALGQIDRAIITRGYNNNQGIVM